MHRRADEVGGVVARPHIGRQFEQSERIGCRPGRHSGCVRHVEVEAPRPNSSTGKTGAIGDDDAPDQRRTGAGDEQGDVTAQSPAEDCCRADRTQRGIDVAHEDLARVAATRRNARGTVTGEIERADRPRPVCGVGGDLALCRSPETVQQEQHRPALDNAQHVERELHACVVDHDGRGFRQRRGRPGHLIGSAHLMNSRTMSATSCGRSM